MSDDEVHSVEGWIHEAANPERRFTASELQAIRNAVALRAYTATGWVDRLAIKVKGDGPTATRDSEPVTLDEAVLTFLMSGNRVGMDIQTAVEEIGARLCRIEIVLRQMVPGYDQIVQEAIKRPALPAGQRNGTGA